MDRARRLARPIIALAATAAAFAASPAPGQVYGMVADNSTDAVVVFDAASLAILGSVDLPAGTIGDCMVDSGRMLGFVTDFQSRVWVIDLAANPPALAGGINPIPISNPGEDLAMSPDGRYLLVSDGITRFPVSVVDLDTMVEVSAFHTGFDSNSVDVGADGSVYVTSFSGQRVTRLTLNSGGVLSSPNQFFAFSQPNNLNLAPGGLAGVAIGRATRTMTSFSTSGMAATGSRTLPGIGLCGEFNEWGDVLYVRSTAPGRVEAYTFDPVTAAFDLAPKFSFAVASAPQVYGMDQMALSPDNMRLFVPEMGALNVYDALTGIQIASLTDPMLVAATGVAIGDPIAPAENHAPTITFAQPMVILDRNHEMVALGEVFSIEEQDGDEVTYSMMMLSDEPELDARGRGHIRGCDKWGPDFINDDSEGGQGLMVRAQRLGKGNGRYYVLMVVADDGNGGVTAAAGIAAMVPQNHGTRALARVTAEAFAALALVQAAIESDEPLPAGLFEVGLAETERCHRKHGRKHRHHGDDDDDDDDEEQDRRNGRGKRDRNEPHHDED